MIDVLIVTAPFTYTFGPSMAPALLKSCVSQQQISAQAWDLSAEFNFENQSNKYYSEITAWMQQPELKISVEAFEWYSKLIDSYATKIIEIFPTWLAISCLTQNSQRFTEDLCYTVRLKSVDKIKIIIGGNGIDIIQFEYGKKWHNLMLDSGLADCVLLGEGDYALTKIIGEKMLLKSSSFFKTIILRFGIIYGERKSNWSAVESIFNNVKNKKIINIGSLRTSRRFIHVKDICEGIIKSIKLKKFNVINLQGAELITLKKIISISKSILKKKFLVTESNKKNPSVRNISSYSSNKKINFRPKISLKEGLTNLNNFFNKQND